MMVPNLFNDATVLLRRAIKDDVADVAFFSDPDLAWAAAYLIQKQKTDPRPFVHIDQSAKALRARIHTLGRSGALATNAEHIIELARVAVPENQIGYLENIEQYVADSEGAYNATENARWGMPYSETETYGDIYWLFRLEPYDGLLPNRFYYTAPVIPNWRSLLPGYPWSDLPEFQGIWYPATQQHRVRANVPSGHMLRMFAFVGASALERYSWSVAGRLTARIQSALSNDALINSRTLF